MPNEHGDNHLDYPAPFLEKATKATPELAAPFDSSLADILAFYTTVVLAVESACPSSATELIGAGYDRLDFQKRYATCNFKLPERLKWYRARGASSSSILSTLEKRSGFNS